MTSNKLTYSKSGVNIPKADSFVKFISSLAKNQVKVVILRISEVLEQSHQFQKTKRSSHCY